MPSIPVIPDQKTPDYPPGIQKDIIQRAVEIAGDGKPWRKVAEAMGISTNALWALMLKYPLLKRDLNQAREMGFELTADSVATIVEDHPDMEADRLRIKADNLRWYLGVMKPARFGQRQTIAVERVDVAGALSEARARAARVIEARPIQPGAVASGASETSEASGMDASEASPIDSPFD